VTTRQRDRILVAVEQADDCEAALAYAVGEAVRTTASIEIVHVDIPDADAGPIDPLTPALTLAEKLTEGRVGVRASRHPGPVGPVLVELSRVASLLVIQHHRLSRLQRLTHGSTAVAVAGRVHCRMVSVPDGWRTGDASQTDVTVGVDAVDAAAGLVLDHAFQLAAREGARLRVVHAWSMSSAYDDTLVDEVTAEEWTTSYRTRLEAELKERRAAHAEVEVEMEVLHRDAGKALLERSARSRLLLVGQGRLVHPLVDRLGSVPRALLLDAACPVEVVTAPVE
jgi:nucleotide-binding universal stress UspA family protein